MLTPERRAELRWYVEGRIAWSATGCPDSVFPEIAAADCLALLDAAALLDEVRGYVARGSLCPMCSTGMARQTVGMVCELCGTDYTATNRDPEGDLTC